MVLEVLVRHVAIAIDVELPEEGVHHDSSLEGLVFDLDDKAFDPLVVHIFFFGLTNFEILVDINWRWISPKSVGKFVLDLVVASEN